jgi:hypothetical protein
MPEVFKLGIVRSVQEYASAVVHQSARKREDLFDNAFHPEGIARLCGSLDEIVKSLDRVFRLLSVLTIGQIYHT